MFGFQNFGQGPSPPRDRSPRRTRTPSRQRGPPARATRERRAASDVRDARGSQARNRRDDAMTRDNRRDDRSGRSGNYMAT